MRLWVSAATASTCLLVALLLACGSGTRLGSSGASNVPGSINTSISDPATCAAPFGAFSHVFVTVKDVKAHTNANAADNDTGFVDLTPSMTPVQVDLLGVTTAQCVLAQLASNVQVPAGTYQQIRLILLDNTQTQLLSSNQCGVGNGVNCVTLTSDGSVHQINITTEATTGIKLSPAQISGGGVIVQANQTANLNLDFNACASLLLASSGQFRLKPVVTAGTVSTTNNSISGRVVDSTTLAVISGGKVIASLQQVSTGVDRVVQQVTPDGAGNFVFCPVPAGSYEVVATAVNVANVAYAATITTGVQPGASLGNIRLIAQPGSGIAASPATITGTVTTTGTSGATADDIVLSALQGVTIGTSNVFVTIPLAAQGSTTLTVTTKTTGCASSTTGCATYTLQVPAANPNVGAFASSGTTYSQNTVNPVSYTVDAQAFALNSAATPTCVPPESQVSALSGGGPLTVVGGATVTAAPMAFTACQ